MYTEYSLADTPLFEFVSRGTMTLQLVTQHIFLPRYIVSFILFLFFCFLRILHLSVNLTDDCLS